MADTDSLTQPDCRAAESSTVLKQLQRTLLGAVVFLIVAVDPVLAQSVGTTFCETELVQTVKNVFSIIQFGGPLIGGVVALGATVATPAIRQADRKQEMKVMRNQAVIWGVIVAPLATVILQFLLNNVVVGGASCGF